MIKGPKIIEIRDIKPLIASGKLGRRSVTTIYQRLYLFSKQCGAACLIVFHEGKHTVDMG